MFYLILKFHFSKTFHTKKLFTWSRIGKNLNSLGGSKSDWFFLEAMKQIKHERTSLKICWNEN